MIQNGVPSGVAILLRVKLPSSLFELPPSHEAMAGLKATARQERFNVKKYPRTNPVSAGQAGQL